MQCNYCFGSGGRWRIDRSTLTRTEIRPGISMLYQELLFFGDETAGNFPQSEAGALSRSRHCVRLPVPLCAGPGPHTVLSRTR